MTADMPLPPVKTALERALDTMRALAGICKDAGYREMWEGAQEPIRMVEDALSTRPAPTAGGEMREADVRELQKAAELLDGHAEACDFLGEVGNAKDYRHLAEVCRRAALNTPALVDAVNGEERYKNTLFLVLGALRAVENAAPGIPDVIQVVERTLKEPSRAALGDSHE